MAANKMDRIGVESLAESRRMTKADIISRADNAYWTYIAVGEKVKLLETYAAQLEEQRERDRLESSPFAALAGLDLSDAGDEGDDATE